MNDPKDLLKGMRGLALTGEERAVMRAELEARSARRPAEAPTALPSPYFSFFMRTPVPAFAMALVAVLLMGGGSAALANGALPGDILYPLKVHVNENVESALAETPVAKADVSIKHAEERLSEVELLAAKGSVNAGVTEAAATEVASAIDAASSTAAVLAESGNATGADGIRSRISSALLAHADILDAQAEAFPDAAKESLRALSTAAAVVADSSSDASDESASSTPEDKKADVAAVAVDRESAARASIDELNKAVGDADDLAQETHDELLLELASIESGFASAESELADTQYALASADYQSLERRAYRALTALDVAERINAKTGKEVVLTINDAADESAASVDAGAASAPTLMKAAMMTAPAASSSATTSVRAKRRERVLEFLLRDPQADEAIQSGN